ncbi:hypothetical protein CMUS01_06889 [Colletotrichum musicola]|uniref:Uncharacterized protein n=1 Tax=Colletotrichum musicola TaxID=2175873 RepID=A0A8H6KKA6_9PEZI|nr:hypothetical protein CMUS01_06889 [Colletotrichum musicola]
MKCEAWVSMISPLDIMSSSMENSKLRACKSVVDLAAYLATHSAVAFSEKVESHVTDVLSIYQWASKYKAAHYAKRLQDAYQQESSGEIGDMSSKESRELRLILEVMGTQEDLGMLQSLLDVEIGIVGSIGRHIFALQVEDAG